MGIPLDPARKRHLETLFPGLVGGRYDVRGGRTRAYNCVAWAVGETDSWYWPEPYSLWPGRERRQTVTAFASFFAAFGYEQCGDGHAEEGFSKNALYLREGVPWHVARIESS